MRVLLVLAMIPLLAACSVFSSSEPPASLAETPPTETVAGATDSTGVPAGATSPADATVTLSPTSTGTSTPPASVSPPPTGAPAPAATAMPAPVNPAPPAPAAVNGTDISGKWVGSWVGNGLFNAPRQ